MKLSFFNIFFAATVLFSCSLLVSCDKVDVTFGNLNQNTDPNITFYQNYQVKLQTLQIDSFLTSSQNIFLIGYNNDPKMGAIHAGSYAQLLLPNINPILNLNNVTYDSVGIVIKSKANYYGDTTKPFALKVFHLTQPIQNTILTDNNYYNTSSFNYNATQPLNYKTGQYFIDSPGIAFPKKIRLSDNLGQSLFTKLLKGDNDILTQTAFANYFQGIYLDVDTSLIKTNTLYAFSDSLTLRLYYTEHGLTNVGKYVDFNYYSSKQFNHIDYNRGSLIPSFPPFVNNRAVLNSAVTGGKAYLNSSTGSYIKISFPDLLNLKTLHPFIKVISAQLVIPPSTGTFNYPYKLPPTLSLYATNNLNTLIGSIPNSGGGTQNGDLFIDNLYGVTTQYTYDITSFITGLLTPPATTTTMTPDALILSPTPVLGDQTLTRLIVNEQNFAKGIQLKLYVLGI